jgi:hypothetical protein
MNDHQQHNLRMMGKYQPDSSHCEVATSRSVISYKETQFNAISEAVGRGDKDFTSLIIADMLSDLISELGTKDETLHDWEKKAWTHQERLLSQRIIYFSEHQIHWECRSSKASDTFPRGLPPLLWESVHMPGQGFRPQGRPFASSGAPYTQREIVHYDIWSSVVAAYNRKQALHGDDKLAGLSGPAKEMKRILNDECIAGHWRRSLSWSLLWRPIRCSESVVNNRDPSFPSWSWAGWKGSLEVPKFFPGVSLIEDTPLKVPLTANSCKRSSSPALLHLRGQLSRVETTTDLTNSKSSPKIRLNNGRTVDAIIHHDFKDNISEHGKELHALWTRLSRSSHLVGSQFSMNALLLTFDQKTHIYSRCGICTITVKNTEANCEFEWSERDLLYESGAAQTINIR